VKKKAEQALRLLFVCGQLRFLESSRVDVGDSVNVANHAQILLALASIAK